jgi:hypothetical protein
MHSFMCRYLRDSTLVRTARQHREAGAVANARQTCLPLKRPIPGHPGRPHRAADAQQQLLHAAYRYALLLAFQALDARAIWRERYRSVLDMAGRLHGDGTRGLRFLMHRSKDEPVLASTRSTEPVLLVLLAA